MVPEALPFTVLHRVSSFIQSHRGADVIRNTIKYIANLKGMTFRYFQYQMFFALAYGLQGRMLREKNTFAYFVLCGY